MKLTTLTATGTKGTATVDEAVFGVAMNEQLLAQAIRVYLANQRQGTSAVKTRAFVNRTKKKWFKQKGTGNARHGARSAPIFVGGGIAHGPKANQNWSLNMPATLKRKALAVALSAQAPQTFVVDAIEAFSGKTKEAVAVMNHVASGEERVLVVMPQLTDAVVRSLRNLPTVLVVSTDQVTAWEVATANKIVVTTKTIEALVKRLTPGQKKVIQVAAQVIDPEVAKFVGAEPAKVVKKTSAKKATKITSKLGNKVTK